MAKEDIKTDVNVSPDEMVKAGTHFGHRISASHPKMKPFLFGTRNTIQIIDAEKSAAKLQEALAYIQEIIKEGSVLLFVGTKIQVKKTLEETAKECGLPWVSERWLGGTFTNFEIIKKRVDYLKNLKIQKAAGDLEKYTKKEQLKIEKIIQGLQLRLGGIESMDVLPKAIFACDLRKDLLAIKEAKKKGIKIIAIADTNTDPGLADYPIPANDDAASSVKYILDKVKETILSVKTQPIKELKD